MKILSINAGSSSLKYQLYEMPEEKVLISGNFERIGIEGSLYSYKINGEKKEYQLKISNHLDAVSKLVDILIENKIISNLEEIEGVGHRVVHGGSKYSNSVLITDEVINDIKDLIPLAPLHNPAHIMGIEAFKNKLPKAISVACFDTAFHQTLNEEEYLYGVPYDWFSKYGVRKYGFHGISHQYLTETLKKELKKESINIITCHLGNGSSISAIKGSVCVDTSMGFTPNAGLIMGTRCGDIDVSFIPYVMDKTGMTINEIMNDLNKKSGLLGISQTSSDNRDIEDGVANNDKSCTLARNMFLNRISEYIAKYFVKLGTIDAICFAGGIGENSINNRKDILNKLKPLGIIIDEEANNTRGELKLISDCNSSVKCYVVPTDEELVIARDTYNLR